MSEKNVAALNRWIQGGHVFLEGEPSAENGFQVLVRGGDGLDVEVFDQHVQDRRGDEGRQGGTEADALDAERQQRRQRRMWGGLS